MPKPSHYYLGTKLSKKQIKEVLDSAFKQPENITQTELLSKSKMYDGAIAFSRSINPEKGISVFDFDDTLARTKSGVRYTMPNNTGKPVPEKKVIFLAGGAIIIKRFYNKK